MIPEQASKLRKGDRILVEMVVSWDAREPYIAAYGASGSSLGAITVDPADIHSILPRPLEAGDRVRVDGSGAVGEIRFVAGNEAWVRWEDMDQTIEPLSDLQRVEGDQRAMIRKAKEG